ncbi:hypothetical protein [uncultured Nostoc sp.]|uniref:hypothetical protein n=1 Tax=uncultured Nostoc sp. TaxID=340711 RepID=UPI0035CA322B
MSNILILSPICFSTKSISVNRYADSTDTSRFVYCYDYQSRPKLLTYSINPKCRWNASIAFATPSSPLIFSPNSWAFERIFSSPSTTLIASAKVSSDTFLYGIGAGLIPSQVSFSPQTG